MSAFYNENDPKAAAWLRELIAQGLIAPGIVDERSILEIQPHELTDFTQIHLFAGIGGWSAALRLAGWSDERRVCTCSCPCQPFSEAGKGLGTADERHLWPAAYRLIQSGNWPVIFGEQVASAAVVGSSAKATQRKPLATPERVWLDGVFADLEAAHYACGAADIPAAGIGAPHIRQRLFWVADSQNADRRSEQQPGESTTDGRRGFAGDCTSRGLAHSERNGGRTDEPWRRPEGRVADGRPCGLADMQQPGLEGLPRNGDHGHEPGRERADALGSTTEGGGVGGMDNTECAERRQEGVRGTISEGWQQAADFQRRAGPWDDFDIIACRDGKHRRIPRQPKPSFFALADGLSPLLDPCGAESDSFPLTKNKEARTGLLRGAGNAILPHLAAEFIMAYLDAKEMV